MPYNDFLDNPIFYPPEIKFPIRTEAHSTDDSSVLFYVDCCAEDQEILLPTMPDGRVAVLGRIRCKFCKSDCTSKVLCAVEDFNHEWISKGRPIALLNKARARMKGIKTWFEPDPASMRYRACVTVDRDLVEAMRYGHANTEFIETIARMLRAEIVK